MAEYSYDVTNPDNEISTVQAPLRNSSKIVYFLAILLLISIGVIIYILLFSGFCYPDQKNESLLGNFNKGKTTDETITDIDLRMMKSTTTIPLKGIDDDLDENTCKSTGCLHTAAHILSTMDLTMAPCQNFYEYACGNMDLQKEESPDIFAPKLFSETSTPSFLKKFRTFYESCIIHEDRFDYDKRLNRTKALLSQVGSFYVPGQKKKELNITNLIANLILYESMPLFDIDIDIDSENTYIMKLLMPDQTSLEFGHWSLLSETKRKCQREIAEQAHGESMNMTTLYNRFLLCQKNYGDYIDSITASLWELKMFPNLTEPEVYKRLLNIRIFIEFEILSKFDQIPLPPNLQELNIKRQYEEIEVGQLKKEFPILDWEYLLKVISNKNISSETKIQMYNRKYFVDIFDQLSGIPLEKLNDAFLAILAGSLYVNTVLPSHRHTRGKYCEERSIELMPDIVNYLLKQTIKTKDLKKQTADIKIIFDVLKDRFRNSLQSRSWLDNSSKASMLNKLDKIKLVMFQNDNIESEIDYLEESYKAVELLRDNYQYNQFNLIEFRKRKLLSLHGGKVSEEDMYRHFVDPTKKEPVYFYANDIVCVPYGLVKQSVDKLPAYMVLANVGFPIAKIIGRAFDRIGIGYGIDLTKESSISYEHFADQTRDMIVMTNPIAYGNKRLIFNLNNDLSESDRIADNTAMRLMTDSFNTFEKQPILPWISQNFSREQIFFLFLTQGLCQKMDITKFMVEAFENSVLPAQFRVRSMLSNSQEFLNTFGCRPGTEMNLLKNSFQFPYL